MKLYVIGAAAITAAVCSTVVNAQSLKDKEYFASEEKSLAEEAKYYVGKCEANVTVKFDWSSPPKSEDRSRNSASGYCKQSLEALGRICESSQTGKDAVKQKIKSWTCGFGKRSIALKDGAVDWKVDFNTPGNDADFAFEYLQNHL